MWVYVPLLSSEEDVLASVVLLLELEPEFELVVVQVDGAASPVYAIAHVSPPVIANTKNVT